MLHLPGNSAGVLNNIEHPDTIRDCSFSVKKETGGLHRFATHSKAFGKSRRINSALDKVVLFRDTLNWERTRVSLSVRAWVDGTYLGDVHPFCPLFRAIET